MTSVTLQERVDAPPPVARDTTKHRRSAKVRAKASEGSYELGRLIAVYLVAVLVVLPLPFGGWRPWATSLLSLTAGAALVAVGVMLALRRDSLRVPFSAYAFPLVLFGGVLAWAVVQAAPWTPESWHHPMWRAMAQALGRPVAGAISLDPAETWTSLLELATYGALFWLALQAAASGRLALFLVRAVIAAGVIYALYGLALYYAGSDTILWFQKTLHFNYVTATFENRNNFATFAGLALIACVGLLLTDVAKLASDERLHSSSVLVRFEHLWRQTWALLVAAGILTTAVLLSGSRGGMISILSGILTLLIVLRSAKSFKDVRLGWVFGLTAAAFVGFIALSGAATLSRFDVDLLREEQRLPAYRVALEAIRNAPLLGSGLGNFEPQFMRFRTYEVEGRFSEAHSDVLENMVELGVPAALILDGVLVMIAVAGVAGARRRRRGAVYPAIAAAVTVQAGMHSLVDFSMQVPAVVTCFVVLTATGFAQSFRLNEIGQDAAPPSAEEAPG